MRDAAVSPDAEWLATNRRGSFAMGTIDRCPRRKYHGLLTVREPGVGEPVNMVAELEEWFDVGEEREVALHSYDWGDTVEPQGIDFLTGFEQMPRWHYEFAGLKVTREVWLEERADAVWIRYSVEGLQRPVDLRLRPLIRCRPIHDLTFANPFMNGALEVQEGDALRVIMHPYKNVPALVTSLHGARGAFHADGHWYEGVHYVWERERGYDDAEDLFTPGELRLRLEHDGSFGVRIGTTPPESDEPQVLSTAGALEPVVSPRARRRGRRLPRRAPRRQNGRDRGISMVRGVVAGHPDFPARPLPGTGRGRQGPRRPRKPRRPKGERSDTQSPGEWRPPLERGSHRRVPVVHSRHRVGVEANPQSACSAASGEPVST